MCQINTHLKALEGLLKKEKGADDAPFLPVLKYQVLPEVKYSFDNVDDPFGIRTGQHATSQSHCCHWNNTNDVKGTGPFVRRNSAG
ncbi:hypothetical protein OAV68_02370 [bacterium]|nr:hypothetical protein [bacterium]